jgi:hypothetical protein
MADRGNSIFAYEDASDDLERQLQDRERAARQERRNAHVSGWNDRTPSGIRERVDEEEAQDLVSRPRQEQHVKEQDRRVRTFDHTQFVAHISDRISFSKNGDMMIQLQIPYQFKHLAEPLTDAFGIPLSFDVEVWAPYKDAKERG